MTATYPAEETVVLRYIPPVPNPETYRDLGMRSLGNGRIVSQCFEGFIALLVCPFLLLERINTTDRYWHTSVSRGLCLINQHRPRRWVWITYGTLRHTQSFVDREGKIVLMGLVQPSVYIFKSIITDLFVTKVTCIQTLMTLVDRGTRCVMLYFSDSCIPSVEQVWVNVWVRSDSQGSNSRWRRWCAGTVTTYGWP